MQIIIQSLFLVIGFIMLMKGADWFVDGAAGIADRYGIPQLIIGLTIVAFGTSAPEAAVSITAALKGTADITIGNVVGSNILNILVILGITAVIIAVPVQQSTLRYEIPLMIGATILLLLFGINGQSVSRIDGILLWVVFIGFLVYLFFMAKRGMAEAEEIEPTHRKLTTLIFLTIIGIVLVVWGSDVTVNSATKLAQIFGLSERFIGLTIVALGTSLPELVTSVLAAQKGKADIAIGNIVGSNLFNILFVVGTAALIIPIPFASNFIIDTSIAIAAGVLLLLCILKRRTLTRTGGIIMLVCYAAYFIYLVQ